MHCRLEGCLLGIKSYFQGNTHPKKTIYLIVAFYMVLLECVLPWKLLYLVLGGEDEFVAKKALGLKINFVEIWLSYPIYIYILKSIKLFLLDWISSQMKFIIRQMRILCMSPVCFSTWTLPSILLFTIWFLQNIEKHSKKLFSTHPLVVGEYIKYIFLW